MTPVAQSLTKLAMRLTESERREFPAGMLDAVPAARCFEVSAVLPLIEDLAQAVLKAGKVDECLAFLPAPITLIEYFTDEKGGTTDAFGKHVSFGGRCAFLIVQRSSQSAMVYACDEDFGCELGVLPLTSAANVVDRRVAGKVPEAFDAALDQIPFGWKKAEIYAALALINSPAHIGRRDHAPHKGLAKELRQKLGKGAPAERPWTEIVLEVPRTEESQDGPSGERLTGAKALHYCRAHARIRLGRVEFVRGHWRGDVALGVVRSTHRVVPPKPRPATPPEGEA